MLVLLQRSASAPAHVKFGRRLSLRHVELLDGLLSLGALHKAFVHRRLEDRNQRVFLEWCPCFQLPLVPMAMMTEHVELLTVVANVP